MEIIQVHIPQASDLQMVFKTDTTNSFINFFAQYWAWLLGVVAISILIYIFLRNHKSQDDIQIDEKKLNLINTKTFQPI